MKIVISIGGSIIVPDEIDYAFLIKLKKEIKTLCRKHKIVIVTGGGKTARRYIQALDHEGESVYTQDLIGIESTRLNALFLANFLSLGYVDVPLTLSEVKSRFLKSRLVVCGGLGVGRRQDGGRTSDGTSAEIANYIGADLFINMTNVSGLYNKDPKKFKDAKFISQIKYKEFKVMMSKVVEKPGQHFILDSFATKIISKHKIKTIILKGVSNLKNAIEGKNFTGTVIN